MKLRWKKYGRIFDFFHSPFAQRFASHAQSPQAIVFDDFVRVYFSTRRRDDVGKFVSCPQYVDFDPSFSRICDFSRDAIISEGGLGCFDEHGIFPFSPVRRDGHIYAYTSGWTRRVSVDVDSGIGLAVSRDNGETFLRLGPGPIVTASLHEPFLVIDAFVREFGGTWYMFYIAGKSWNLAHENGDPERVYAITYATSKDGIFWEKSNRNIIANKLGVTECQALPTVIQIGKHYCMIFCYRHMTGFRTCPEKSYALGFAYSSDLTHWTRADEALGLESSLDGWDVHMQCYPHVFSMNGKVYLLYNGNDFGKDGFGLAALEDYNDSE